MTPKEIAKQAKIHEQAIVEYVQWFGGVHDDGCPEDDTCECSVKPINDGVTAACKFLLELGAALQSATAEGAQERNTTALESALQEAIHIIQGVNPQEFGCTREQWIADAKATLDSTPTFWTTRDAHANDVIERKNRELSEMAVRLDESEAQLATIRADTLKEAAEKYNELLFAVARKYPGESRHETALRYIREREMPAGDTPKCGHAMARALTPEPQAWREPQPLCECYIIPGIVVCSKCGRRP